MTDQVGTAAGPQQDGPPEVFDGKPVINFRDNDVRRRFLKTAAVIGAGSTLAAATRMDPRAWGDSKTNDLDILNYALTLEYLEADFYTQGLQGGALSGQSLELVKPIRDHEQEHVKAVKATIKDLGGKAVDKPKFKYPEGTFTSKSKFLKTASTFEELGVTAYHGQVARVKDGDILAAAASIAGVESRHAAVLAYLIDGDPFPEPFEKRMTMDQVLAAAKPFIKS